MSEKKKQETIYNSLTDEQKSVQIPYYLHEGEMNRMERINKRLRTILIIVFIAFVVTNAGWIAYESQFETVEVKQEVDNGAGNAYVAGVGDVNYGQSQADDQNPGEEEQFQESVEGVPNL